MVFENRALRRKFGPKRNEVTEEWRKLHNEELNDLYYIVLYYIVSEHSVSTRRRCRTSLSVHLFLHFVSVLLQISWPSTATGLLLIDLGPWL
jgi:hypothetical protein